MLAEIATLRAAALTRQPAPHGPDVAWYVSARDTRLVSPASSPERDQPYCRVSPYIRERSARLRSRQATRPTAAQREAEKRASLGTLCTAMTI